MSQIWWYIFIFPKLCYDSVNILKGLSLTGNKYSELMADDIISKTDLYENAMETFLNQEVYKE